MPTDPPTPQTEHDLDYGVTLRGLRTGLKVFGRYTLVRMLGRGGMGVVWLARDDKLDLDIALKFLPNNLVGDESALADLRHETRRCMKLHHTHIVHVYDLVDDDATAAIAMEFVDGRPLSALRAEKAARVMDVADVLPLLRQTCEALTYAHETAKIVHHDLKPANLMLTKDGILKVMDFGIASSLSDSMSKHSRVGQPSGSGGGTLPYMSPQQIMGYPPSVVDDIYSLGATLYELLTGKPPFFRGDLTRQIESITPPTISARRTELGIEGASPVPDVWEQVVAACLEKDSDKRPPSVRAVWQRLSETGAPVPAANLPVKQPVRGSVVEKTQERSADCLTATSGSLVRKVASKKPIVLTIVCVAVIALVLMTVPRQKAKEPKLPQQTETADTAAVANDFNTAQIGDTRVVDLGSGVKLTLCYCPAGSFTMGSPPDEPDRVVDENQVPVKISRGYWLAKTECTQAQWRAVMNTEPSNFKGDDLPVEQVSWEDAQEFMTKLNGKNVLPKGWKWSLPTEAQWEYACRAGTTTVFSFGESLSSTQANFDGNYPYGGTGKGPYLEKTSPVCSYAANAWGLVDMHGNVYEWCSDWYADKLPGGTDPTGASSGSYRVDRGGSWSYGSQRCRSACRSADDPGDRYYRNIGFRAAAVPVGVVETMEEKQMAVQAERERLLKEAEMKKQAAANDFNTAQIGDTRVVDLGRGVKLTLCYCPAGSFTMGSPVGEADRSDDEEQVQVRISRGFWLAKTECTQAQWRAVMGTEPSSFKSDDLPVEQVSWEDAQEFMAKLNSKNVLPSGWQWGLPTEAQWEYACRAGTTTAYAGELERMAWYSDNSGSTTHAVGTKAANAWGLQDMHGNAWEWCSDWYDTKLPGGIDPTGASSGSDRMLRGGSWVDLGRYCRSAARFRNAPGSRRIHYGFRAASVPVER